MMVKLANYLYDFKQEDTQKNLSGQEKFRNLATKVIIDNKKRKLLGQVKNATKNIFTNTKKSINSPASAQLNNAQ